MNKISYRPGEMYIHPTLGCILVEGMVSHFPHPEQKVLVCKVELVSTFYAMDDSEMARCRLASPSEMERHALNQVKKWEHRRPFGGDTW